MNDCHSFWGSLTEVYPAHVLLHGQINVFEYLQALHVDHSKSWHVSKSKIWCTFSRYSGERCDLGEGRLLSPNRVRTSSDRLFPLRRHVYLWHRTRQCKTPKQFGASYLVVSLKDTTRLLNQQRAYHRIKQHQYLSAWWVLLMIVMDKRICFLRMGPQQQQHSLKYYDNKPN